jgi:uncharacterized repeat protein (TIGR01451 family)
VQENAIVAFEKDGNPLPETTRLVLPLANGNEWISMITRIELVDPNLESLDIRSSGPAFAHERDTIKFSVNVTNLDGSPFVDLTIKDEMVGFNWIGSLAVEESKVFDIVYVVPTGAKDPLTNEITASARLSTIYAENNWTVDILHPKIDVERTSKPTEAYAGENVTHRIILTNTGDTDLFNLTVVDSICGYSPRGSIPSTFRPGDSYIWSFNASADQSIEPVATATCVDALGMMVSASGKSFGEPNSTKTDNPRVNDPLLSLVVVYAPILIVTAALVIVVAYITEIRRRKDEQFHSQARARGVAYLEECVKTPIVLVFLFLETKRKERINFYL